jgi:hypothetical protein
MNIMLVSGPRAGRSGSVVGRPWQRDILSQFLLEA